MDRALGRPTAGRRPASLSCLFLPPRPGLGRLADEGIRPGRLVRPPDRSLLISLVTGGFLARHHPPQRRNYDCGRGIQPNVPLTLECFRNYHVIVIYCLVRRWPKFPSVARRVEALPALFGGPLSAFMRCGRKEADTRAKQQTSNTPCQHTSRFATQKGSTSTNGERRPV